MKLAMKWSSHLGSSTTLGVDDISSTTKMESLDRPIVDWPKGEMKTLVEVIQSLEMGQEMGMKETKVQYVTEHHYTNLDRLVEMDTKESINIIESPHSTSVRHAYPMLSYIQLLH